MSATAVFQVDHSVQITLPVQPQARPIGLTETRDDCLKISVNSPPEDGKAHPAVSKLIAATPGIATSQIKIIRGATSRNKDFRVVGITLAEATERLLP
jgi:uncharacterized protein YggU (UPF0235/DUF167 family)